MLFQTSEAEVPTILGLQTPRLQGPYGHGDVAKRQAFRVNSVHRVTSALRNPRC